MSEYFQLKETKQWNVRAGAKVIKAAEYALLSNANDLIGKVKSASADAVEQAKAVYKKRYDEGYAVGLDEGKSLYTEKLMDMVMGQVDSIEGLEKQLVSVVMDAVSKIIGSFDQRELVTRVVHQGLNAVRGSKSILMRVSSQDERILRESLHNYLVGRDNPTGYINLVADPNLKVGDCLLETEQGVVEASLNSQLRILQRSLENHIKRK